MNKCYWVYEYFVINGEKVEYAFPFFSYGDKTTFTIDFKSFDELYNFAKEHSMISCQAKIFFFNKHKYVRFPLFFEGSYVVTAKNFSKVTFVKEYKEFNPTVEEAMKFLTVEQFKEYVGFSIKEEIK